MPPDQSNEQEIQFKKRARRRLVGAVALVLLMVTVLPMVLNDRVAKSPQQEIAISIPSQDGGEFDSKVVPVGPIAPEPIVAPESAPVEDVAPAKAPPSTKMEASKPVKPVSEPASVADPKPEAVKTATAQKSVVIPKSLPEKNPKESSNTQSGTFTVQIGVFSDLANVKKLQQKLQATGYKSYTEMIDTPKGQKIRLRAGPFANRTEADDALAAIKEAGLSGLVVSNK